MPKPMADNKAGGYVFDGVQYAPGPIYPLKSGIVSINAQAGIPVAQGGDGSSPFRVSRIIPPGCRVLIRSVSITVLNGPAGQLLLSIGSGMPLSEWNQVNGQLFSTAGEIPINQVIDPPGPMFIDLSNITGTTYTGAQGAGVNINCVVMADAILLVEANRGSIHHA